MNEIDAVNELLVLLCRISNDVTFTGNESYLKVLVSKSDDVNAVIRLFVTLINLYDEDLNLMPIQQLSDLCHGHGHMKFGGSEVRLRRTIFHLNPRLQF